MFQIHFSPWIRNSVFSEPHWSTLENARGTFTCWICIKLSNQNLKILSEKLDLNGWTQLIQSVVLFFRWCCSDTIKTSNDNLFKNLKVTINKKAICTSRWLWVPEDYLSLFPPVKRNFCLTVNQNGDNSPSLSYTLRGQYFPRLTVLPFILTSQTCNVKQFLW